MKLLTENFAQHGSARSSNLIDDLLLALQAAEAPRLPNVDPPHRGDLIFSRRAHQRYMGVSWATRL
jgi:hypothetical protein